MSLVGYILTDLGIISQINTGKTLAIRKNKLVVVDHTKSEGVYRYLYSEDRNIVKDIIKRTVESAIEYSELLIESRYLQPVTDDELHKTKSRERFNMLTRVMKSLKNAIVGIQQLQTTYKNDSTYVEELKSIIANIEFHVRTITKKIEKITANPLNESIRSVPGVP